MRRLPQSRLRSTIAAVLSAIGLGLALGPMPAFAPSAHGGTPFREGDVIAFAGGATSIAVEQSGALETLLTLAHPGSRLRFRNLAWEGDTVDRRPRELNFPSLADELRSARVTVACLQFGASETLLPQADPAHFREAYGRLIDELRPVVPRLVLVTPPPFEAKPPPLPDLAARNDLLARHVAVVRELAEARGLPLVDLFGELNRFPPLQTWTHDGRELTPAGHLAVAVAWLKAIGRPDLAQRGADASFWRQDDLRRLRAAVRDKNKLWTDSRRPMNWAFLHGDRTEQLASRDHRDPKTRWFPAEMEQFPTLITEAEARIDSLAAQIRQP